MKKAVTLSTADALSRDPAVRLQPFVTRGLIHQVPTRWQFFLAQVEMGPYVVLPDRGDDSRYAGAPLGHPMLRTPIVLREIGLDHLRVGHGLHAKAESVFRHLMFVFHEGMPVFDLQLVQTVPNGLERLAEYTRAIEEGATDKARSQRRRIDMILPGASAYRQKFIEPGGWIARCANFDYPDGEEIAEFLRPEFTSLVRFANYAAETFEEAPARWGDVPPLLAELATRAFRGHRTSASA